MDVHPTAVVLLQSRIFLLQPPKPPPAVPPPMAGCAGAQASPAHPTPIAVQAIPLLTNTSYYSPATAASHHSRTSEPSYSPPRGHPLLCLRRLWVVPFVILAIVHCVGSLDAAWSTLSTNDSHRKRHVRGVADSRDPHGPWPHATSAPVLCENK